MTGGTECICKGIVPGHPSSNILLLVNSLFTPFPKRQIFGSSKQKEFDDKF